MKEKFIRLLNKLLLVGGAILTIWCVVMWQRIGFRLEPKYTVGNQDGNFFLLFLFIGIAATMYAFGELTIYSKKIKIKKSNSSRKR
jgi:hypothetical protein